MTRTTRLPATPGGEIPGGRMCCSPSLHVMTHAALVSAVFADDLLKGESAEGLVYTLTCASCVVTTACSRCGEVLSVRIDAPDL
jgi:hypothetical protein